MSKRLERAIAKLRKLPKGLQDTAVIRLLEYVDEDPAPDRISIEEAREAYANGDFLTLSTWKRDLGFSDN
jgi:hypothetical protein